MAVVQDGDQDVAGQVERAVVPGAAGVAARAAAGLVELGFQLGVPGDAEAGREVVQALAGQARDGGEVVQGGGVRAGVAGRAGRPGGAAGAGRRL